MLQIHDKTHRGGDLLAIGFGATVVLWAAAYVGLSPAVNAPAPMMAAIVLIGLLLAGTALGWWTDRGPIGGVKLGLLLGLVNFIIVASLQGGETTAAAVRDGVLWIIGSTIIAIAFCALGAWLGKKYRPSWVGSTADGSEPRPVSWTSWFSAIVAIATVPLIVSGGIVTGLEAGLDVPDWLTTFGYPMMFYPMAMMQEDPGVYAEHFHRLWGLLVGLSVIFLVVHLFRVDSRMWLKTLAVIVLLAVCAQGLLGAAWVLDTQIRHLAVAHGVFGQIVFATIVAIAAFSSARWLSSEPPQAMPTASSDRFASGLLIALLILQLAIGALYRHLRRDAGDPMHGIHAMYTHIVLAFVVAAVAMYAGGRAWGTHRDRPVLPRLGRWLIMLVGAQIVLGFIALVAVLARGDAEQAPVYEVVFTTAHQAIGAVILAVAALLAVWVRRLLTPVDAGAARRTSGTSQSPAAGTH